MAKNKNSFSVTGDFFNSKRKIKEETKDDINWYDLDKILERFDGYKITLSISAEDSNAEYLADEQPEEE